jgi:RNase P subunit RPR2
MGELYINGNLFNGKTITEYCDKCQKMKPVEGGYAVTHDQELVMWICLNCQSTS